VSDFDSLIDIFMAGNRHFIVIARRQVGGLWSFQGEKESGSRTPTKTQPFDNFRDKIKGCWKPQPKSFTTKAHTQKK